MSGFLCRVLYTGAYVNADVIFFSTYSSHPNERATFVAFETSRSLGENHREGTVARASSAELGDDAEECRSVQRKHLGVNV